MSSLYTDALLATGSRARNGSSYHLTELHISPTIKPILELEFSILNCLRESIYFCIRGKTDYVQKQFKNLLNNAVIILQLAAVYE